MVLHNSPESIVLDVDLEIFLELVLSVICAFLALLALRLPRRTGLVLLLLDNLLDEVLAYVCAGFIPLDFL